MVAQAVFEDIFEVLEADPGGKKFDKVSRVLCRGENYEMDLVLDVHSELCPLDVRDKFSLMLTKSIELEQSNGPQDYASVTKRPTLMDKYDYVMHGTVFHFEAKKVNGKQSIGNVEVLISFGGLMLSLTGDARNLQGFEIDKQLYLLLRKN